MIDLNQLVQNLHYPDLVDVGVCEGSCIASYHDGRHKFGKHYHHIRLVFENLKNKDPYNPPYLYVQYKFKTEKAYRTETLHTCRLPCD